MPRPGGGEYHAGQQGDMNAQVHVMPMAEGRVNVMPFAGGGGEGVNAQWGGVNVMPFAGGGGECQGVEVLGCEGVMIGCGDLRCVWGYDRVWS